MAIPWIKIEHATPDKPEIVAMAQILGIDQDAVLGKCIRLWVWADQQCVDGNALTVTESFIDRLTHQPGFSDALRKVDWLQARSGSLAIPHFDRHNGQTAKARADTNRRVTKHRDGCNGYVTPKPLQKPLPEKDEEEDKKEPPASPPCGGQPAATAIAWAVSGWTGITDQDRQVWAAAYPACDIEQQLARMHAWLIANPKKAVKSNWRRFIVNWLTKSQDRGGDLPHARSNTPDRSPARPLAKPGKYDGWGVHCSTALEQGLQDHARQVPRDEDGPPSGVGGHAGGV